MLKFDMFSNIEINNINNLCREIHSALFLAYSYYPKPIDNATSNELKFWTATTNICGLFYDCMPYVFRASKPSNIQRDVADLLCILNVTESERKKVRSFAQAVMELRSCFCHNKTPTSFNGKRIVKGLGKDRPFWIMYPHLQMNSAEVKFDYAKAYELLSIKAYESIAILRNGIKNCILQKHISDSNVYDVIQNWETAISAWYLYSNDIKWGALTDYLKNKGVMFGHSSYFEKLKPEELIKSGHTMDHLLDLCVSTIDNSAILAYPDLVYQNIFDKYLIL